jgi:VIT1/CCC1 family predicted Fe2+/Mn2+ transporter
LKPETCNLKPERNPPRPQSRSPFTDLRSYIFGSSAAIITDVSLIVGMGSARTGKGPVLVGLLTIAVADNISDSLGIHLYKESEGCGEKLTLLSTVLNFVSRLLISCTFITIVLVLSQTQAVLVGLIWGLLLIVLISYLLSRSNQDNPVKEIVTHVLVAVIVITLSRFLGAAIATRFHMK